MQKLNKSKTPCSFPFFTKLYWLFAEEGLCEERYTCYEKQHKLVPSQSKLPKNRNQFLFSAKSCGNYCFLK